MKVYSVEEDWVMNGESGGSVRLFKNKKDAEDIFVGKCYEARINMQNKNATEDKVYTDSYGTTYFSIYEEGYYDRNHINIQMGERKVEE